MKEKLIENDFDYQRLARQAAGAWVSLGTKVCEIISIEKKDEFVRTKFGDWVPKKAVNKLFDLYEKLLNIAPEDFDTRLNRAIALDFLNRFDEAKDDFLSVANYVETVYLLNRVLAFRNLSVGMLSLGCEAEAKKFADQCNALVLEGKYSSMFFVDIEQERKSLFELKENFSKKDNAIEEKNISSSNVKSEKTKIKNQKNKKITPLDKDIVKIFGKIEKQIITLPQWHTGNPNWREETSLEEIQQAELAIKIIKEDVKHLQKSYPDDDRVSDFCKNANYFL